MTNDELEDDLAEMSEAISDLAIKSGVIEDRVSDLQKTVWHLAATVFVLALVVAYRSI